MPVPNRRRTQPPLGQARQSQVLQLYGPGAMVDFPDYALLIGGLDLWDDKGCDIVYEPRLLQLVRQVTGVAHLDLKTPPKEVDRLRNISGSIKAFRFPEWSVAQKVSERLAFDSIPCRARPLVHFNDGCIQDWRRYRDDEGEYPLVPVRFVMACPHGHLSDIPWRDFCFRRFNCKNTERLYLLEAGTGNDFTQIHVQSESGVTRKLADALVTESNPLGHCQSRTPWLGSGRFDSEICTTDGERTRNRLLVRSASNAYFTEMLSVISLPEEANGLARRICELKDDLGGIGAEADVPAALKFNPRLKNAFADVEPVLLWQEIEAQRGGAGTDAPSPKDEELKLFVGPMDGVSSSAEDSLFEADVWRTPDAPAWYRKAIRRVLLVHRLREVQALVGFTRFTPGTSSLGGLPIDTTSSNRRAALANNLTWAPASENKGEGIFLELDPHRIRAWAGSDAVTMRTMKFREAFKRKWLTTRGLNAEQFPFPGAPYLLLHSLSHLLITEAVVVCVDEKTQIQAVERTQPMLPLGLGTVEGVTHDTIRNGTTTGHLEKSGKAPGGLPSHHEKFSCRGISCRPASFPMRGKRQFFEVPNIVCRFGCSHRESVGAVPASAPPPPSSSPSSSMLTGVCRTTWILI